MRATSIFLLYVRTYMIDVIVKLVPKVVKGRKNGDEYIFFITFLVKLKTKSCLGWVAN